MDHFDFFAAASTIATAATAGITSAAATTVTAAVAAGITAAIAAAVVTTMLAVLVSATVVAAGLFAAALFTSGFAGWRFFTAFDLNFAADLLVAVVAMLRPATVTPPGFGRRLQTDEDDGHGRQTQGQTKQISLHRNNLQKQWNVEPTTLSYLANPRTRLGANRVSN